MGILANLISFVSGTLARSSEVNSNLALIANAIPGTTTSVNGPTTGTATATVLINNANVIMTVITFSSYRNGPSGDQNLALPVPYLHSAIGLNGSGGVFHMKSSGTSQTVEIHNVPPDCSTDGTVTGCDNVRQNATFHIDHSFDTLGLFGSDSATHNGIIFLIGS